MIMYIVEEGSISTIWSGFLTPVLTSLTERCITVVMQWSDNRLVPQTKIPIIC